MFYSVRILKGRIVRAVDGDFGKVDQFYFDDQSWAVRYIVVDIGGLFAGKKILLSPNAAKRIDNDRLHVNVTIEQIRQSPDIDTDKPVSRIVEQKLHDFYGWPYYWGYPAYYNSMGTALYPDYGDFEWPLMPTMREDTAEAIKQAEQSHLRSSREIIGYGLSALNETIGRIDDMLVDAEQWVIRYVVADTGRVMPCRKVVLAAYWIRTISWEEKTVSVDIPATAIRSGPALDPTAAIDREFETRLFDYYRKPHYWANKVESKAL